jgi:hypothetical protein
MILKYTSILLKSVYKKNKQCMVNILILYNTKINFSYINKMFDI